MAVNDLIAQGVRPMQIESPLNMMAKMQALREAEQQNQMFQQKQQDYQREQQLQNALRGRLSGGGVNIDNAHELLQYGGPGRQAYESLLKGHKEQAEAKNLNSQVGARTSENAKREVETLDKYLSTFRSFVPTVRDADGVASYVKAMYAHPVLGPMATQMRPMDQALQANLDLFTKDPRQWQISNAGLTGDKLVELMKGTRQNTDLGGANVGRTVNAFGEVVPGSEVSTPTTVSPDAALASKDRRAALAQSAAQHADNQKAPTVTTVVDPTDQTKQLVVDARTYKGGGMGSPGVIGGSGKEPVPGVTLSAKEIQKREAQLPQATKALETFNSNADTLIKDLMTLRNHKGLSGITGLVRGRGPGVTDAERNAETIYNRIQSMGGFAELTNLRSAGGSLGPATNTEHGYLRSAFSNIDRKNNVKDVQNAIDEAIRQAEISKKRIKDSYDTTYEYRSGQPAKPAAPTTPPPPPGFKPD